PAHGKQLFEKLFLGQTQESVQAQRVFANMGVDVERDVSACRRHFRKRWHADRNVIADSVRFHDRLVRTLRQQRSSKMRNHRGYCTAALPAARRANKIHFSFPFHRKFQCFTVFTQCSRSFPLRKSFGCRKVLAVKSVRRSEICCEKGSALPVISRE